MAELKTKENDASVEKFLKSIDDKPKRADANAVVKMMQEVTESEPRMWGASIIGFGNYKYVYKSGRAGDWFKMGLSPRKQNLTLYLMGGLEQQRPFLDKFGKHKTGKGCLYIKSLADVNSEILKQMMVKCMTLLK